jgi:transcriptional regulator with XRE-family HTH domain
MAINERIKQKRCELGISQQELAAKIGTLNQSQIAKIELGNRNITAEDLVHIAKALNVPVNDLIRSD